MRPGQRQDGVTLISLLVGLVISMIVVVALMNVFRSVIRVTANANVSANSDNQLASSLLRSGMSVLDAGYGITSGKFGTHIVLISGATLSASGTLSGTAAAAGTTANAVVWAYQYPSSTSVQCAGLYAFPSPSSTSPALAHLGPINCSDATGWNSATWASTTVAGQSSGAITFVANSTACQPLGIGALKSPYSLTMSGPSSATQSGTALPIAITQCLMNIVQ